MSLDIKVQKTNRRSNENQTITSRNQAQFIQGNDRCLQLNFYYTYYLYTANILQDLRAAFNKP